MVLYTCCTSQSYINKCILIILSIYYMQIIICLHPLVSISKIRPVARLFERGVHVKNMWASGQKTHNLMHFKLS